MQQFSNDDAAYLRWLSENPAGYVLNVQRVANPSYTVLHRATCRSISLGRDAGAYTDRGYRKVAARDLNELRAFSRSLGREDGSFSHACGMCSPLLAALSHMAPEGCEIVAPISRRPLQWDENRPDHGGRLNPTWAGLKGGVSIRLHLL